MRPFVLLTLVLVGVVSAESVVAPSAAVQRRSAVAADAVGRSAAVMVATHPSLGPHLVDQDGRTVYGFVSDRDGPGRCSDACLERWPPLLAAAGEPTSGSPAIAALLSVAPRRDGGGQVAFAGWPLYRFVADAGPGDVAGHGLGGVWFALAPDGTAVAVPASAPEPAMPKGFGAPRGRFEAFTLHGPQLVGPPHVVVYLPPGYDDGELRYPVVYLKDGQNVFDRRLFGGRWLPVAHERSWLAHAAADRLAAVGRPVIVVAVASDAGRAMDYLPFAVAANGHVSRAEGYTAFLVDTLKPHVDGAYRTRAEPAATAIVGSSFGGIVSLYAALTYPEAFGFVAALSATWGVAEGGMEAWIADNPAPSVRVYLDYGTREGASEALVRETLGRVASTLDAIDNDVAVAIADGGAHVEADWAVRLPGVLERFAAGLD
jgi:predicted alpha/beta superfamily hydrolase/predicted lipoprotein with Yx(FWY)xxD motif